MSESIGNSEWVPVAEAAGAARLPIRTAYNWVKGESIESRQRDGVTLVRLDEVMAKASKRPEAAVEVSPLPALPSPARQPADDAGIDASPAPPSISTAALPTDLLAHLIGLFEHAQAALTRNAAQEVCDALSPWQSQVQKHLTERLDQRQQQLESAISNVSESLSRHRVFVCDLLSQHFRSV